MNSRNRLLSSLLAILVLGGGALMWHRVSQQQAVRVDPALSPSATKAGNFRIGDVLPELAFSDEEGKTVTLAGLMDSEHFTVLVSHHPDCPCARNCGRLINEMQEAGYSDVRVVGFMSQGTRDAYDLASLKEQLDEKIITFPVYFDHDGSVMRTLGAERTPEIWVLDKEGRIRFWGAPENTLFPGSEGHRYFLREAIDALRRGADPEIRSYAPIGCPIEVMAEI